MVYSRTLTHESLGGSTARKAYVNVGGGCVYTVIPYKICGK